MQFFDFIRTAGNRITVKNVNDTVVVEILFGIRYAVRVKIPATDAVVAIDTVDGVSSVCSRCAVAALASGYSKCEKDTGDEAYKRI